MKNILSNKKLLTVTAISIITFICFSRSLQNEFTMWDDDAYVTKDSVIQSLTPLHIKKILTEDITQSNYHPLCMVSLAINYQISGLNPSSYYFTNIVIHILNVILVFFLFYNLCAQFKLKGAKGEGGAVSENGKLFIAGFGALLFGIHPMHVESVSWVSERKDVLYAFFYFFGLLRYVKYITTGNKKWLVYTFLLFLASCLSKPMGVVFPMSLVCIDILLRREWNKKLVTEKIIFFVFALILGGVAFYTQGKAGTIASFAKLTLAERFMYASYGYVMYISKLFNPAFLSTFYPYPLRYIDSGLLPSIFYAAPFLAILIPGALLYYTYKKQPQYFPVIAFGFGFFTVNVMFVLQFISVGAAIMADRYSYVSYIGLVFMVAYFFNEMLKRLPSAKTALLIVLLLISGALGGLCYQRTAVWHDTETLCSDAIDKFPYRAWSSYKWRGNYYRDQGKYDDALADYLILAKVRTADMYVYESMSRIYTMKNDYEDAYKAHACAEQLRTDKSGPPPVFMESNPGEPINQQSSGQQPLNQQDNTNLQNGSNQQAGMMPPPANGQNMPPQNRQANAAGGNGQNDVPDSIRRKMQAPQQKINPDIVKKIAEMGFKYLNDKKYDSAIDQYGMAIMLTPSNPYYYFFRGVAYFNENKVPKAIDDWSAAYKINVPEVQKAAAFNLSVAYDTLNKDSMAAYYLEQAVKLGQQPPPGFSEKVNKKKQMQRK